MSLRATLHSQTVVGHLKMKNWKYIIRVIGILTVGLLLIKMTYQFKYSTFMFDLIFFGGGESGIRNRGPKILNHKLNTIPKSTAFEISNLGFMAFPAGIYNEIVDGNQTFQQYYPI